MSNPILALIPSGQKATKVYSVIPSDGSGDFTFDRDTTATRVRKDGLIEEVAADIPRLDWLNSNCPNLLLEPSATQLAAFNTNIKSANSYTLTNGTLTENTETAPDGTLTASTFKATATNGQFQKVKTSTSGAEYTVSVYVKRKTGTGTVYLRAVENANTAVTITDQWTRVSATVTSTSTNIRYGLALGTSGDEVYVWGFQVELGGYASSFIFNTTGSDVTRNLETCKIADFSSMPSSYPITVYGEVIPNELSSTSYAFSLLKDVDTNANYYLALLLRNTSTVKIVRRDTDTTVSNSISHTLSVKTPFKFAVCFQNETDFKYSFDGLSAVTVTSSDAVTWDFPDVLLGALRLSADTGKRNSIKEFRLYDTELTDAELKKLTT